ncbi:hypothetical protein M2404_000024 [Rheinheimera pacifica]|uniref:hypothetical protein n=1 Tax=Rheinheimera pacifica TaxID=173990 RepID=UPI002167EE2E|nr:hypothetical protein [Rheinheimera pacifica]MCS4305711.1 hypothetical protein [Rheinheimera pacifica]
MLKPLYLTTGTAGRLVVCLMVLLVVSGCSRQVRWMHPTPSKELLLKAMTDLHGFHVYSGVDTRDNSLLSREDAQKMLADNSLINSDTPNFMFVSFSGNEVSIVGYNQYFRPETQDYRSPMIYRYRGQLKRAVYSLPHMAPVSGDLTVTSKPIENVQLWLINEQKTAYPDFNGTLKFQAWSGEYFDINAYTTKSWDYIF